MKILAFLGFVVLAWMAAAGVAEAVSRLHGPRGQMVDIGGRKLRLVCEGPAAGPAPTIWMESGAFNGAADFAAIQQTLAAKGLRSCAYDRAGMGYSPAGPKPRDGDAIVGDLEKLIVASGEPGPFVLMSHSMGGLYVRQFAARNPDKVAGLVLVESVTPEMMDDARVGRFFARFLNVARLGAAAGTLGLTKPLYLFGDRIGLPPQGRAEKRRGFISGRQSRAALAEVLGWKAAAIQARAAGPLRPEWPVAVVTAGPDEGLRREWNAARRAPERGSLAGAFFNVDAAGHADVLGPRHNAAVIRGVEHVIAAAQARPAGRTPEAGPQP